MKLGCSSARPRGVTARKAVVLTVVSCNDKHVEIRSGELILFCVCRRVYHIRRNKAATTIQRHVRGWLKRTQYKRTKRCVLGLQTWARGLLARRRYQQMRYNYKVCTLL